MKSYLIGIITMLAASLLYGGPKEIAKVVTPVKKDVVAKTVAKKDTVVEVQAPDVDARNKGGPKTAVRNNILKEVSKYKNKSFTRATSARNKLEGFVTYSTQQTVAGERPYVAYIYLNWGDLDNLIPRCSSKFYENWNGHVKVQLGGYCSVVQEFAFDSSPNREPGIGTGIDKLLKDSTSSQVRWLSAVVGATDGLLIKISMQKEKARGEIKAGTFTIPYEIVPAIAEDKKSDLKKK